MTAWGNLCVSGGWHPMGAHPSPRPFAEFSQHSSCEQAWPRPAPARIHSTGHSWMQPPNLREFSVKTTVEKNTLDNKQLNHVKPILSFSEGVSESIEVVWEQIRVELQFQWLQSNSLHRWSIKTAIPPWDVSSVNKYLKTNGIYQNRAILKGLCSIKLWNLHIHCIMFLKKSNGHKTIWNNMNQPKDGPASQKKLSWCLQPLATGWSASDRADWVGDLWGLISDDTYPPEIQRRYPN